MDTCWLQEATIRSFGQSNLQANTPPSTIYRSAVVATSPIVKVCHSTELYEPLLLLRKDKSFPLTMADGLVLRGGSVLRRVSFGISPSSAYQRPFFDMSEPIPIPASKQESAMDSLSPDLTRVPTNTSTGSSPDAGKSPNLAPSSPGSPRLSRNPSVTGSSSYQEDWELGTPLDRLTVFDLLDNFALPQQIEKWQRNISAQTLKVKKQRDVGHAVKRNQSLLLLGVLCSKYG